MFQKIRRLEIEAHIQGLRDNIASVSEPKWSFLSESWDENGCGLELEERRWVWRVKGKIHIVWSNVGNNDWNCDVIAYRKILWLLNYHVLMSISANLNSNRQVVSEYVVNNWLFMSNIDACRLCFWVGVDKNVDRKISNIIGVEIGLIWWKFKVEIFTWHEDSHHFAGTSDAKRNLVSQARVKSIWWIEENVSPWWRVFLTRREEILGWSYGLVG